MLRAKRAGADRIEIFTASMRGEDENRLPLESDLRKALEKRQLAVLYQPITRLASNQLAGFEALLRWDHPTHGRLGAEEFVPIAEETGLIGELGSYVLGQALEEASRWHKMLPRERDPLFVSVNVSSRQLFRQDLVQEIRLMLAKRAGAQGHAQARDHRVAGHGESRARRRDPRPGSRPSARASRSTISAPAIARLSYLHRFPCDTIKVDRSLVRDSGLNGSTPVDPALDHRARARARQRGGGRGRGDRRGRGLSPLDRLRIRRRASITASRCRRRRWRTCSRRSPATASGSSANDRRRRREAMAAPAPAPRPVVQAMPPTA